MKRRMIFLLALATVLWVAGCSQQQASIEDAKLAQIQVPQPFDAALIAQYNALNDSGYQLMDQGKTEEAVAAFARQESLIPAGKWSAYNSACAYGRVGQLDKGFEWLTKAIAQGWDDSEQLKGDTDLETLRADPRFAPLLARVESNQTTKEGAFASGLPTYTSPSPAFPSTDSLERWTAAQQQAVRRNRSVWYGWQYSAALMDLEARKLAALRELKKTDPTFDYGLERVRSISRIKSIYNSWGPLADGVVKEADTYLATKPSAEGQSEAQYRAALALYCRKHPSMATDPDWLSSTQAARARFAQVQPGTKFDGAAIAWQLMFDLMEAGENKAAVLPKVREFTEKFKNDEPAMQIAGSFYQADVVASLWPIPIETVDIDNQPVTLDQYKGRVVLVDFWATWCGPCRGELPGLLAAYQKYHDKGFDVLSISLDYADKTTPEDYRKWINEKGMNWRHVYDQKDWNGPLVKAYLVRGIPSPVMVGRDGSLVGMGDDCRGDKLAGTIEKALTAKTGV